MKRITKIFLLALFMISCQAENSLNHKESLRIQEKVAETFKRYYKGIEENGLSFGSDFLYASPRFYWVPPGYHSAISYDSVVKIHESKTNAFKKIEFEWQQLSIDPLSLQYANYTGIVKGSFTDQSGATSNLHIIETGTMINDDGAWKFLCGQSAILDDNGAFLAD